MNENQYSEFLKRIQTLEQQNEELAMQNAALKETNEQLLSNEEEMKQLSEVIFNQRLMLEKKSEELEEKSKKIEDAFNKLKEKNEEINTQKEILDKKNKELEILNDKLKINEQVLKKAYESLKIKEHQLIELNSELEKLSIVARETDNAVSIYDAEYNLLWFNEGFTRLYGYTFDEFIVNIGINLFQISSSPKIRNILNECIETQKSVVYQSQSVSVGSKLIWTQTTLTPLVDENNIVVKFIGIDSDITKLKEAELEIEQKKDELEEKNSQLIIINENIKSSIRYANTIQQAILPRLNTIIQFETFLLFRPRDIVSGDFYWHANIIDSNNNYDFFAVVDCTGHGVPGAFMSMIGNSLLNEIIIEKRILETNTILDVLNKRVIQALNQEYSSNTDGMDVCLVRIEASEKVSAVQFSGAKRPLICYNSDSDEVVLIPGCRINIGGFNSKRSEELFTYNNFSLSKNSILYLSSDGYIDQNSPERKRFGSQNFVKFINEICRLDLISQLEKFKINLQNFMQNEEQRDDITVLAVRL